MDVRILLIAREGEDRDRYMAALRRLGASVTAVSSFRRLDRVAAEQTYHGVMVDLHTKIKALRENRDFVYKILDRFPLVQVKVDPNTGRIRAFHHHKEHGKSLEAFIGRECANSAPRRFRLHRRRPVHFNTRLFRSWPGKRNGRRTVTLNLSKGGCFIVATGRWQTGEVCWVSFRELTDPAPIRCEVRHVVPWGTHLRAPGVGVAFKDIRSGQVREIENRFLQAKDPFADIQEDT